MYAIIRLGGKQYRVQQDSKITVNRLVGDAGASLAIDEVLALGDGVNPVFGKPYIDGASVTATIIDHSRGKKINGLTYKAKKNVRRHYGHRQELTTVQINAISAGK